MNFQDKREIVNFWFNEIYYGGNTKRLSEITTPDFECHSGGSIHNKKELSRSIEWYLETFAENDWALTSFMEQDNKIVAVYETTMVYKGGWYDIPSTNQQVKETGIMIFEMQGDKIDKIWCEMSDLHVLYQLGGVMPYRDSLPGKFNTTIL